MRRSPGGVAVPLRSVRLETREDVVQDARRGLRVARERTLGVHAGPLPDGRWATPLRFPEWSLVDGEVDEGLVWMAIDCASGWYTSDSGSNPGRGLTVQFAVQIDGPLDPNGDYALVAWHGDHLPDWDGRKRGAAAALFDRDGVCVARSASYWVRPRAEAS